MVVSVIFTPINFELKWKSCENWVLFHKTYLRVGSNLSEADTHDLGPEASPINPVMFNYND